MRRSELWLAFTVFVAAAYFYGGASWNQNARLDAVFTFVEPGPHRFTFRIDPFLPLPAQNLNTGDWSKVGEHYYANKAPGTQLFGVLVYFPLYLLEVAAGFSPEQAALAHFNAFLINVFVSVLPMCAALVAWSRVLSARVPVPRALALTLLAFLGSALFPYSTQIWGHTTSAALLMLALYATQHAATSRSVAAAGLALGLAVTFDFLALPTAGLIAISVARKRLRDSPWLLAGALGPLLLLLGYQWYCFGSPWSLPTEGTQQEFLEQERWLGLFGAISGEALFQLSFGQYRGIFLQMPLLLAAPFGFVRWWRRAPRSPELWIASLGFVMTWSWVGSFNGWHGGSSVCARYLMVVLPLLMLALAELPDERRTRFWLGALGLVSALNMLAVAAVSPLADARATNPLLSEIYPHFWTGRLHPHALPIRLQALGPARDYAAWDAWNWGELAGLSGLASILPWIALVAFSSWQTLRAAERENA